MLMGLLYALPNLYGEDLAVQVSMGSGEPVPAGTVSAAETALKQRNLTAKDIDVTDGRLLVRVPDEDTQLKVADALKRDLDRDTIVALNLAPTTPDWLQAIGGRPMALGLDLRGGVHFLLEVDIPAATQQTRERFAQDMRVALRDERIRTNRDDWVEGDTITIRFRSAEDRETALNLLKEDFRELDFSQPDDGQTVLQAKLSEEEAARIADFAMSQSLTTLRNRVNELGVAEPLVQRQGANRIVVQLPGVQDTARAKEILGATATLEYRLVAEDEDPYAAQRSGVVPLETQLYQTRDGRPILLKRDVITTGDHIVGAQSGIDTDSGSPAVFVTLDGQGAKKMLETTQRNVNRRMAVLFKETKYVTRYVDGEPETEKLEIREVINDAVIRGVFGKRFQTTGLESNEARNLSLLLRAGALPAPVEIVEERTVGPSLGKDNIEQGRTAVIAGFLLVIVLMAVYYRRFGLIANCALLLNLVFIMAVLSLLQATLTLPGIAGIVLTVGMAVDANVLIFERIREELASGNTPQSSINAGYDKAFSSIADANVTTLIAALVLFGFGTGPIKGFAVTLSIGIVTSMFTAIFGTRVLVNALYGGKRLSGLSI
ncbi:MAG: protein translocase subunit SecD [Nevskiales bacterium]